MASENKVGRILTASDLSAALIAPLQNWLVGTGYAGGGYFMPAIQALLVSGISRGISSYMAGMQIPMTAQTVSGDVSNILIVGLSNLVLALLRGLKPVKQAILGMEIDSLSYSILQSLPYYPGGDVALIQF